MGTRSFYFVFVATVLFFMGFGCTRDSSNLKKISINTDLIDSLNACIPVENLKVESQLKETDSLFLLSEALNYEKGIVEAAANYIYILRNNYQYEEALTFVSNHIEQFEDIEVLSSQAKLFKEIAELYQEFNNFDQAFNYYTRSLKYYQQSGDQVNESAINSKIGLLFRVNDEKTFVKYLRNSIDISIGIGDSVGIAREFNNIGVYYIEQQKYDSARYLLQQAATINKRIRNWDYYIKNLMNLAHIEKINNDFVLSEKLQVDLLQVMDSTEDVELYANSLLLIGDLYNKMGKYEKALPYFENVMLLSTRYHWLEIRMYGFYGLYLGHKGLGHYIDAMKYQDDYVLHKDSLEKKRNFSELTRLELVFKNNRIEQAKQWKQQKQKILLYASLGILVVFLAFLFQLYLKQKHKIAKNKLEGIVLQRELETKERELTSFLLNMIRLNKKKLDIIDYLKEQKSRLKKENQDVIETVIRNLEYDQDAQVWAEFEVRFNNVNSDFYQKLSARFPNLSNNEKRLCAFLQMNMTTKEISALTGQNPSSVEKARYRLRKKLNITGRDIGIFSYLSDI